MLSETPRNHQIPRTDMLSEIPPTTPRVHGPTCSQRSLEPLPKSTYRHPLRHPWIPSMVVGSALRHPLKPQEPVDRHALRDPSKPSKQSANRHVLGDPGTLQESADRHALRDLSIFPSAHVSTCSQSSLETLKSSRTDMLSDIPGKPPEGPRTDIF